MASSSSFAEEELADPQVEENSPGESVGRTAETTKTEIKKKKKKVYQVADCDVRRVLSYKPDTLDGAEVPEIVIKKDPMLAAMWYDMLADMALFDEIHDKKMLERQIDYRHQLKTKGRVTYEVEVDDDDDKPSTTGEETAIGGSSGGGGRGRRRHRPGVMKKQDGQTRKLN
uniref:Uncharacterized protein n=1 Tax=Avena sativa TaxID=4498 RepID=A0ACD5ZLY5_AVESA